MSVPLDKNKLDELLLRSNNSDIIECFTGGSFNDVFDFNSESIIDFSHGMEAYLNLLANAHSRDMEITTSALGFPFNKKIAISNENIKIVRKHLIRALYEEYCKYVAICADKSNQFIAEPQYSNHRVVIIGCDLSEWQPLLEEYGRIEYQTFCKANYTLEIMPCFPGGVCGISAEMIHPSIFDKNIENIILGNVERIMEISSLPQDFSKEDVLLYGGGVDYKNLIKFADGDEKKRLSHLVQLRRNNAGHDIEDITQSYLYKALHHSLLSRIYDCINNIGYGYINLSREGHPESYHYSCDTNRELNASLLALIGDRDYVNEWIANKIFRNMRIISKCDTSLPDIVLLPPNNIKEWMEKYRKDKDIFIIKGMGDYSHIKLFEKLVDRAIIIGNQSELLQIKPVITSGVGIEKYFEGTG